MASSNTFQENLEKNDENSKMETIAAQIEAMITPEQVLSASVARKRRNVTRNRNSKVSGGSNTVRAREQTPVREWLRDNDFTEKSDDNETPDLASKEPYNKPPKTPARKSRDLRKKTSILKSQDSTEVLSLLEVAKRSASSHCERRPREHQPLTEKKSIVKRSQSQPRQGDPSALLNVTDEDLIESFKKAQRLSAEVGTNRVPLELSSESSLSTEALDDDEDYDDDNEESKTKEEIEKERRELKEKLALIKREKEERNRQLTQKTVKSNESSKKKESNKKVSKKKKIKKKDADDPKLPEQEIEKKMPQRKIFRNFIKEAWYTWKEFLIDNEDDYRIINSLRNRCFGHCMVIFIYCGLGGMIFRFTEGAFENFYKCGVKRVKRDFIDSLWLSSHNLREDDWKSMARKKLWDFEEQLHEAHEAGVTTYSGQRSWSFLNAVVYCLTVVTTIGYGHITPSTTTGRAITIIYAVFGIPMFLILLADFGKLFTRGIKFIWAFVRRLYYTGSCRKVRKTETVQDVMKGVQMVYDIATFRRPSQADNLEEGQGDVISPTGSQSPSKNHLNIEKLGTPGDQTPNTPAPSNFAVDDEFNLPVSVAILILIGYIFCGASVYYIWEDWGFFESFYFVFISMSTIGFGDFVPNHPMYMMASILYLVFGLALTSMCINVVQVKLSDTFRQASAKIGATIGLRVAEDDGSITQTPAILVPPVEEAEVHTYVRNKDEKNKKNKNEDKENNSKNA